MTPMVSVSPVVCALSVPDWLNVITKTSASPRARVPAVAEAAATLVAVDRLSPWSSSVPSMAALRREATRSLTGLESVVAVNAVGKGGFAFVAFVDGVGVDSVSVRVFARARSLLAAAEYQGRAQQ